MNAPYRKEKGNVPILAKKINDETVIVVRKDVKKYVDDPDFLMALQLYNITKMWGLPNGAEGWVNEPCDFIDAITAIELEAKQIEQEATPTHANNPRESGIKGSSRRK